MKIVKKGICEKCHLPDKSDEPEQCPECQLCRRQVLRDKNPLSVAVGSAEERHLSRRQFVKTIICGGIGTAIAGTILNSLSCSAPAEEMVLPADQAACGPLAEATTGETTPPPSISYSLPDGDGLWLPPPVHIGRLPTGLGQLEVKEVDDFTFDINQTKTLRPDIFQPGHFSVFDALVQVAEEGKIRLEYHFDETLNTHIVDSINGRTAPWWYLAKYSGGWFERKGFRMDMFPYKNRTRIRVYEDSTQGLEPIFQGFRQEVTRLKTNGGKIVIPKILLASPRFTGTFRNVVVEAHDVRKDVLKSGVVTGLDAILSLAEQGNFSRLRLTWYRRIGIADPVDSYWVQDVDEAFSYPGCGFVYETGTEELKGLNHIHIPSDTRVTVSPDYARWFWICLEY